jgi:methionyl aminopeptidase
MISIKSRKEIKTMREGGKILAGIMKEVINISKAGTATDELNRLAESLIFKYGGRPSFKGHEGYPATLCTSLNEEIVHALPSSRELREGDILSLDLGIIYKGFHTDMAVTIPIGEVDFETKRLMRATRKALKRGIRKVRPKITFGDVSNTIQRYAEDQGFSVVRELCGHGIGKELHEEPQILNYGKRGSGEEIKEGMCFCLEPMLTCGGWEIEKGNDGFSFKAKDGSMSAHFEHTLAVTAEGCQVLTRLD